VSLPKRAETSPYSSERLVAVAVALVAGVLPSVPCPEPKAWVMRLLAASGLSVDAVSALAEVG